MKFQGIPGDFTEDTSFNKMHFWVWACSQEKRNDVNISNYLKSLGFVVGQDKLTPAEYDRLSYAVDAWHRTSPYIRQSKTFDSLFTKVDSAGFYVQGREGKYAPCQEIIQALHNSGWVYAINPSTTYFEIIGNRVYAKYQCIIGSRFIVEIKE